MYTQIRMCTLKKKFSLSLQTLTITKQLFDQCKGAPPNLDEINNLLDEGVDINSVDKEGKTPLLHLFENSNAYKSENMVDIVRCLLRPGNVNLSNNNEDEEQNNALYALCYNYKYDGTASKLKEMVEILMKTEGVHIPTDIVEVVEKNKHIVKGNKNCIIELFESSVKSSNKCQIV